MEQRYIVAHRHITHLALAAWLAACTSPAWAQLPSFNGAEGYGGTFTGSAPAGGWFSNGSVYHVTTTQDLIDAGTGKPAIGTLRGAFYDYTNPNSPKQMASNRVVVFDVGGTFQLTQGVLDIKTQNNVYVAGQTAPSPVVVYGDSTQITHSNNTTNSNFVLRYMTFRRGSAASGNEDTVTFKSASSDGAGTIATNMIIDHASASWGTDENLSVANNNTNVTVQYSIISDALRDDHAYGSLIRPRIDSSVTYHHNLYANNASRQARFGTYFAKTLTADFRNNVVYNFRDRASYAGGSSETPQEFADVNYVGNYIIAGPGTGSSPIDFGGADFAFRVDKNITAQVYQSGNFVDPDEAPGGTPADGTLDGSDTGLAMFVVTTPVTDQTLTMMGSPFATAPVTTQTATAAYQQLTNYVGNWWWDRDVIDSRVVDNVTNFTGVPLAAADPIESERLAVVTALEVSRPAGYDTDFDGMPNEWESTHGLNPNSSADFSLDFDSDGYINLQEYLDEIGAFPAPTPIVFDGGISRYAEIQNWRTNDGGITTGSNWQPSRFDEAQINSGTVVVDAIGQHAGVLKIGANAGDNAILNITGGRLDVAEEVVIGADPAATAVLNLSGGILDTPELSKGPDGSFNFTGGTLHADTVHFNLVNNGGALSPGHSVGQTHVEGDLVLDSGSLAIELASTSSADSLLVDDTATLGGALNVSLLGSFTPTLGDNWQIIAAGDMSGMFSSITAGYSVLQQGDNLRLYFGDAPSPVLAGDYNDDGTVDAADYTVWRDSLDGNTSLLNETASPGVVDGADYAAWKANFGAIGGGSGSVGNAAVPEPATAALFLMGLFVLIRRRR